MTKKSYDSILIESLHHKMDTVIESLQEFDAGSRQRDMDIKQELKQEIHMVWAAVQMVSKDLGQKIDTIHLRLNQHEVDITKLKEAG